MLITNGVEEQEYTQLKKGFESEQATVIVTSPGQYITVESLRGNERGDDIITDIPNLLGSKTGYTDLAGGNLTVIYDAGYNGISWQKMARIDV